MDDEWQVREAWNARDQVRNTWSLFSTCFPMIPLRARSIVIKDQGNCCPLKEITFVYFSQLISVQAMTSLAIQTIVGVCLADGLLMKTLKKSARNESFLVYM